LGSEGLNLHAPLRSLRVLLRMTLRVRQGHAAQEAFWERGFDPRIHPFD